MKTDGSNPSAVAGAATIKEEVLDNKIGFCFLVKTWTIYYITLTFALLAIFRLVNILLFSYVIPLLSKIFVLVSSSSVLRLSTIDPNLIFA